MSLGAQRARVLQAIEELPPLNEVARHLIGLLGDDRVSARDLDHVIRNDQALTARVLRLANSSTFGKSRRIASLTDAVILLGDGRLADLVLGVSAFDAVGSDELGPFAAAAWDHSIDCAAAARAVAGLTDAISPDTAFVAGLMHDIGLLVMLRAAPAEMAAVLTGDPEDPLAAERRLLGLNHPQVGQRMLEKWNLPTALCEAVRLHHAPDRKFTATNPLINQVALADLLTAVDGRSLYPTGARWDLFALLRACGATPERLSGLFAALDGSRAEAARLLAVVRETDAPVGATAGLSPVSPAPPVFAVSSGDVLRRAWYEGVLRHLGVTVVNLDELAAGAGADWLLADLQGCSPDARARLARLAEQAGVPLALVTTSLPSGAPWQEAPRLEPLITRRTLGRLTGCGAPLPA